MGRLAAGLGAAATAERAVGYHLRRLLSRAPLTSLGWSLLAVGVLTWAIGVRLGWVELLTIAAGSLLVPAVATVWTLRRPGTTVTVSLVRRRVVVGEQAVAKVTVRNLTKRRHGGCRIEIPVGHGLATFEPRTLAAGGFWEDSFIVPTDRRAVVPLGPPQSVTGDPLGAARRESSSGEATQLFVHPITVRLPSVNSGWLRDLEGQTTNDLSTSDVAFHTLREYVPGDDRRHIHWRTSAKIGTLMVRQFVDTRRSHLGLVLSLSPSDWADDDEFEFGVQVVGSIGRTAFIEDQAVSSVAGSRRLPSPTGQLLLDGLAGVSVAPTEPTLPELIRGSVPILRGASIVVLVVGSNVEGNQLRRQCERFPPAVRVAVVRCQRSIEPQRQRLGRLRLLQAGDLDGLARILQTVGVT